jgi:hypothetical protein
MNIGKALLVQSGTKHCTENTDKTYRHSLYTRLQWLITYYGIEHADTIAAMKKYNTYCKVGL